MFLPTGDAPNYSHKRPWVNWGIIALNVLVYVWAVSARSGEVAYHQWVTEWGFVPVAPRFETFFTSMFMHAGFMHLAGNMLFLWVFGDNVEGRLGHVGYLLTYLACGLAAVLLFAWLAPNSGVPLVGASGAIFGVEGFYFLTFAKNRVRVIYWFFIIGVAWIPARIMLGFSFVLNLLYMLSPKGELAGGGVAYAAHVGGFVFGLGAALALRSLGGGAAAAEPVSAPRTGTGRRADRSHMLMTT
ncbi:MAG: rhomboid family intramembrane serine protease, partial [Planctomycetota bacterium]